MPINIQNVLVCLFVAQAGLKAGLSSGEVEELLSLAKSQPIKDKLKRSTQEALEYKASIESFPRPGTRFHQRSSLPFNPAAFSLSLPPQAFGFPLIVCHVEGKPQVFFGSDRFELMAHCIGQGVYIHYVIVSCTVLPD